MAKNSKATEDAAKSAAVLEGDRNFPLWVLAAVLNIFALVMLLKSFSYF
jgi:hypothetical protein